MDKAEKIEKFLEELRIWSDGVVPVEEANKLQNVFALTCKKCGSEAVQLGSDHESSSTCGYGTCENSGNSVLTIKCLGCGAAVSIDKEL